MEQKTGLIYSKIAEVRKKAPKLSKDGVGPQAQGSYKYLRVDDILEAIVPIENEVGIISYPVNCSVDYHYNVALTKDDGRVPRENVQGIVSFVFRYVAVADGSFVDVTVPGEGIDSQDKATRKATTQAQKIANILVYNLITGEPDPDSQDGGATNQEAHVPPAVKKATATPTGSYTTKESPTKKAIREEFVDKGIVDRDTVNRLVKTVRESGATGDTVFDEVLNKLRAGEVG